MNDDKTNSAVEQAHELNRRVLENPKDKLKIIQEFYSEQVQAGDRDAADLTMIIRSIATARDEDPRSSSHAVRPPAPPTKLKWKLVTAAAIIICVIVGIIVGTRRGAAAEESDVGPHPAFWNKLPPKGKNNEWYDDKNPETVIVLVHGIFSDSRGCWLYRDSSKPLRSQYWPDLIQNDVRLEHPAIFLGGYATSVDSGPYDARQAAVELRDALKRESVLDRSRIIFIAHSTGGIVVRFLLLHNQELFRGKMIGLALYASPSIGSPLANMLSFLSTFYHNKLSEQLQRENPFLTELDKDFRDLLYNPNSDPANLRIVGAEGVENFFIIHRRFIPDQVKVVPEDSASHYFGAPVYLRGTDHFTTVKPDSLDHPGHQLLLTFFAKYKKDFGITSAGPKQSDKPLPLFTTVYDEANAAGQPYIDVQVFEKNSSYTQPPKPAGDHGHELKVNLAAPGPIMNVAFRPDGEAAGWTHETAVNISGSSAQWLGWSNSAAPAQLIFTIRYKVARQVCVKNCE